jgi:transposase
MVCRHDDLTGISTREKDRLDCPARSWVRRSVERTVRLLKEEDIKLHSAADAFCPANPKSRDERDLLESVPQVGQQMATTVMAGLSAIERRPSPESAAEDCGLAQRGFRSGTSVRTKTWLSKTGNTPLRKALFLTTQTAVRFNPLLRGFFGRLTAAGKPRMQAVGACMRKLVMVCYGVLKNRAPFDPTWAARIAP